MKPIPQKPTPAKAHVGLSIKPVVGDKAPTLTVTVDNPNKVAVPLTRFADPVCFAHHYLVITLTGPGGKPVKRAAPGCAIKDWPGTDEKVAAGTSATIEVPLTALFGELPKGTYEIEVDWDPTELEKARPGTGVRASQTSTSGSRFVIAKPLSTFKILRGKSVNLPGGHRLTFRAHGHKHTMAGGPPSPLIIRGEITVAKKKPVEFDESVQVERNRVFQLEGLTFELGTYEYDNFMELRYFGPIALE